MEKAQTLQEIKQTKTKLLKTTEQLLAEKAKKKLKNRMTSESKLAAQNSENPKLTLKNT